MSFATVKVEMLGCTWWFCLYACSPACAADSFIVITWCLQIEISDDTMQAEVLRLNLMKGQVL